MVVFQRDLRAADNAAFLRAAREAERTRSRLVPVFLMDDRQLDPAANPYRSGRCVRLMAECLAGLSSELRAMGWPGVLLLDFRGAGEAIARGVGARSVHLNADFTPFARARDAELRDSLESLGAAVCVSSAPEYTLWETGAVLNKSGEAYRVYGPFARACGAAPPPRAPSGAPPAGPGRGRAPAPRRGPAGGAPLPGSGPQRRFVEEVRRAEREIAGSSRGATHRARALRVLGEIRTGGFDGYARGRDGFVGWPENRSTTGLSLPMKFGAVSCREAYRAMERAPALRSELLWREFHAHVAAGHPRVLAGQADPPRGPELNRHERADRDKAIDGWRHSPGEAARLARWEAGETGEALVDAAMRQLRATGRLHNRLRMVAASHLVKAMGVDWRRGERAFARLLADYDPASNGGGWRAMDAQAPGREIAAHSQARRFDPKGEYAALWAGRRSAKTMFETERKQPARSSSHPEE